MTGVQTCALPISLTEDEMSRWEQWRRQRLSAQIPQFMADLQRLSSDPQADQFILQELQLWLESVVPSDQ